MYLRHILEGVYGRTNDWASNGSIRPIVGCKFGLELEVEGESLPRQQSISPYWIATTDGSLRALPESMEYKSVPLSLKGVEKALDSFGSACKKSVFRPSVRTSTHLHINVQDMTVKQIANFITVYLLLEGSLYSLSGKHRKGNVFCIPLTQCDDILRRFGMFCKDKTFSRLRNLAGDGDKYSALSLRSMYYYGTLEVRTHEGITDKELGRVLSWTNIFNSIREYATKEDLDPILILQEASNLGPIDFVNKFLGAEFNGHDVPSFWDGVSSSQYFANSSKWEQSSPLGLEETPDLEEKKEKKKKSPNVPAGTESPEDNSVTVLSNRDYRNSFSYRWFTVRRNTPMPCSNDNNRHIVNLLLSNTNCLLDLKTSISGIYGIPIVELVNSDCVQFLDDRNTNISNYLSDYDIGMLIDLSESLSLTYAGISVTSNQTQPSVSTRRPTGGFSTIVSTSGVSVRPAFDSSVMLNINTSAGATINRIENTGTWSIDLES